MPKLTATVTAWYSISARAGVRRSRRKRMPLDGDAEFKRGWDAAITAARHWHEGQASQAMVLSRRTRFPKALERDAGDRRKFGGAAANWLFSRLFSGRGWMRGLDVEAGKDRG